MLTKKILSVKDGVFTRCFQLIHTAAGKVVV